MWKTPKTSINGLDGAKDGARDSASR
eukprot:COSAG02_NODE_29288_length_572_cov_0.974630_1_plen_25_part_01